MKFDPFTWKEVQPNAKTESAKGWLRLRVSAPAPLYIEAEGVEALCGFGTAFDVEVSEDVIFRVDAPKSVRVFVYEPFPTATAAEGEVFTNIDRMPHESGAVAEVVRARRQLELERRALLRDIRAARDQAVAAAKRAMPQQQPVLEDEAPEAAADEAEA